MSDVTPKTESGRALLRGIAYPNGTDDPYSTWGLDAILAIEQEAASKAVAEVLDRLGSLIDDYEDRATLTGHSVAWDLRALIASERPSEKEAERE